MSDFMMYDGLVGDSEYQELLEDMMCPQEIHHALVKYRDGQEVLHSFSSSDKLDSFVERLSAHPRVYRVGVIKNYLNYTDEDNHLFVAH